MNNLTRWDPFREMLTMRNAMDRLFESTFSGSPSGWLQPVNWDLALDVSETEDEFVVKASIPGINPDDLDITYNANTLTIRGETKAEEEKSSAQYHLRERRYGTFSRSITLPTPIKADEIRASYDSGVLTLHLPKAEEAKPKRISIQGGASTKVLEGKVGNGKKR